MRNNYSAQICLAHFFLLNAFTALKGTHFYILFVVTAAGVGRVAVLKSSPVYRP